MLKNDLKSELPLGWENMFNHREDWDPKGYSVGIFKLPKYEKELVLARNDKTFDIMDYFFDDTSLSYQINLKMAIKFFTGKISDKYTMTKDYIIYGKHINNNRSSLNINDKENQDYPRIMILRTTIRLHRLIAFLFIPNPYPDKYSVVNHKNKNISDFRKENLEWCDFKWNNKQENRKKVKSRKSYLRLRDNKLFTNTELEKEYKKKYSSIKDRIYYSIKNNTFYDNSKWQIIDTNLQNYLNEHPLTDIWYKHPVIPNVFANSCGVLKINGILTVGTLLKRGRIFYKLSINKKQYQTHRLLAECYFNKVLDNDQIIDHIIPVTNHTMDNSIENIRITDQLGNMNNPITLKSHIKTTILYNIFGEKINEYESLKVCCKDGIGLNQSIGVLDSLVCRDKFIIINDSISLEKKLSYIYYKWKINDIGERICINGCTSLGSLSDNKEFDCHISSKLRKYLNTGMPAPDGYYYQQGTPREMIYDPTNTELEKKRPEIHWKDRNKE